MLTAWFRSAKRSSREVRAVTVSWVIKGGVCGLESSAISFLGSSYGSGKAASSHSRSAEAGEGFGTGVFNSGFDVVFDVDHCRSLFMEVISEVVFGGTREADFAERCAWRASSVVGFGGDDMVGLVAEVAVRRMGGAM